MMLRISVLFEKFVTVMFLWPSSLVAIPVFAPAISLSRTVMARAIATATLTILRSVVAAIAQRYPDEEY